MQGRGLGVGGTPMEGGLLSVAVKLAAPVPEGRHGFGRWPRDVLAWLQSTPPLAVRIAKKRARK
jgi:hypothetical protein